MTLGHWPGCGMPADLRETTFGSQNPEIWVQVLPLRCLPVLGIWANPASLSLTCICEVGRRPHRLLGRTRNKVGEYSVTSQAPDRGHNSPFQNVPN